jgi:HPt (histidine-containing phosphotransfer) domain-containing protein
MEQPVFGRPRLMTSRVLQGPDEPDEILELVEAFVTDTTRCLERLHKAAATGDVKTLAHEAHTLKGSAAALGAALMRAHAELLERDACSGLRD